MKLIILPNFAENQVCSLRVRFHRDHTTTFVGDTIFSTRLVTFSDLSGDDIQEQRSWTLRQNLVIFGGFFLVRK